MKLRFRQEEFLEDVARHVMCRWKQNSVLENVTLQESTFFGTQVPKKMFLAETPKGKMRFEEWEPGVFEKIFEVV